MDINKKKLNRDISLKVEMQNPFRKNKAKEIIKIVRKIRKGGHRFIIRRETSQDEFKEDFADFMIGDLENDLNKVEDIAHEIDKESNSLQRNKKTNK